MQLALFDDVVEQFPARDKFHYHENISRGGNNLIELDNVRMPKKLKVLDFSTNFPDDIETFNFLPIKDFDGYFVLRNMVLADFDLKVKT